MTVARPAFVRIVCKNLNATPPGSPFRILNDYTNCHVFAVHDDGSESRLDGVTSITFTCKTDGEPARAVLEFANVEADIEAFWDPTVAEDQTHANGGDSSSAVPATNAATSAR